MDRSLQYTLTVHTGGLATRLTFTPAEWERLLACVDEAAVQGKDLEKLLPIYVRRAYATGRWRAQDVCVSAAVRQGYWRIGQGSPG